MTECSSFLVEPGWMTDTATVLDPEIQSRLKLQKYEDYLCSTKVVEQLWFGMDGSSLEPVLPDHVLVYMKGLGMMVKKDRAKGSVFQCAGVASLQLFVAANWLGYELDRPVSELIPFIRSMTEEGISKILQTDLIRDGDSLNACVRYPELLLLAKMILVDQEESISDNKCGVFWSLRCCSVLSSVLEEKSDLLHKKMEGIVQRGIDQDWGWDERMVLKPLFLLECARFHNIYYRVKEADKLVEMAAKLARLDLTETGALGKRTKYQVKDIAQFCVDLGSGDCGDTLVELNRELLVRDIKLEDDVRLDKIKFKDEGRDTFSKLTGLQQAVLMAKFASKLKMLPVDNLTGEEVLPYLLPLLENPQAWSLHSMALLSRSRLESNAGRTVERSLAQVENIVENIKIGEKKMDRIRLVYCSNLPPVWEVEKELGKLLLSLGSTKSALEIYLKLEHWEEVITCYSLLELRHKAAEVIKARLTEKETPRMWCLLGDATDDLTCYHKALELSGNKSARAYRSLAMHHYTRKEFKECVPLFEKSLDRSSFQPVTLLRLAFAAMDLEMWELAAKSYRSYCSFEMDSFEAWNNLAKCYTKLNQKERAWRVLQEALRCDYDNWKVWDNLLVISTDIAVFEDVLRSYNRLLDLKQTHIDKQVLEILVMAVMKNLTDREGNLCIKYKERVLKLLARITVAMPKEATPWKLYGMLLTMEEDDVKKSQEEIVRGVQCYQKSLAALTGPRGWEKNVEGCKEVISLALTMVTVVRTVEGVQELQLSSSMRLSISSAVKMIEQGQTSVETGLLGQDLRENVDELKSSLSALTERISQLRAG